MPKYIDIDGYRKLFDEEYKETKKLIEQGETHLDNLAEGFHEASQVIDRIPPADVQEVRRGHWYWYENKNSFYEDEFECGWKCSCCNGYPDHDNYMADDYEYKPNLKYCPNCGARMDESATDIFVGS